MALNIKALACLVFACSLTLTGCDSSEKTVSPGVAADASSDAADDPAARIAEYRSWKVVNQEPYDGGPVISELCRVPPSQDPGNPHTQQRTLLNPDVKTRSGFIRVWVNEPARQPMLEEREPRFPNGSIIVKEKLVAVDNPDPELLTVMIKRAAGFNPELGDWEFLVTSGDGQLIQARGRLENCQRCHSSQSSEDFVFRDYLPSHPLAILR